MNIEKLKAEFEQSECFKKLEHVAQYTFFEFGAYLKRTDVPDNVEKKCGHLITALIFSWGAWKEAKAHAVPEGFVLIKDDTKTVVAIERMVEQQVEASGMDSRRLERLDGWKIIEAAVKAQEPAND